MLPRLWLDDDPAQNKRIDALLAEQGGTPGSPRVTDVVLAQALWTLRSAFEQDKDAQLIAVCSPLEKTAFAFVDREAVVGAVALFQAGAKHASTHPGPGLGGMSGYLVAREIL